MSKLYFSINKDATGTLCEKIFVSKTKTTAKNELRDIGLTPKMVLSWDDICKVEIGEFEHKEFTEEYNSFVLEHIEQWSQEQKIHQENIIEL